MNIFIGCSASLNIDKKYHDESKKYLDYLFKENNNDLVFGSCKKGLMGLSYEIAKANNKEVTAINLSHYKEDLNDIECNTVIEKETVSQRIQSIIENSDVFIFLPGGIGSINELFMFIESKRCHENTKPIIICNINNHYDTLIKLLEELSIKSFSYPKDKELYIVINSLEELKTALN